MTSGFLCVKRKMARLPSPLYFPRASDSHFTQREAAENTPICIHNELQSVRNSVEAEVTFCGAETVAAAPP
jgi:hypothetical protein